MLIGVILRHEFCNEIGCMPHGHRVARGIGSATKAGRGPEDPASIGGGGPLLNDFTVS
jgi:hypothetical protein